MPTGMAHLFFNTCKTSVIGVSAWPHGMFSDLLSGALAILQVHAEDALVVFLDQRH